MDLLSLVTACAVGFSPQVLQGVILVESEAQPWSFRIEGDAENYAFADLDGALRMARKLQQLGHRLRIGYAGLQGDMPGVVTPATEAMFMPCVNIHLASQALATLERSCRDDALGKRDPLACALALYRASAGKPDTTFAGDVILQASLGQHAVPAVDFKPAMSVDGMDGGGEFGAEPAIDPAVAAYLAAGGPLFPERAGEQGIAEEADRRMFVRREPGGAPVSVAATTFTANGKPIDDSASLASRGATPHSPNQERRNPDSQPPALDELRPVAGPGARPSDGSHGRR
ncbi:MAG: hypothetical protein MUE49_14325 [Rhodospirillales bacterium]|jgi:hypothetical protein|nr:hypothetical protein [Rhodospirillales bacterium]